MKAADETADGRNPADVDVLLDIRGLQIRLPQGGDREFAVESVDLQLRHDEILCLVGESGSGKSLTARAVLGLLPGPRVRVSGGQIRFLGEDLLAVPEARMREVRGRDISMIFQEPMTALNPLMTVGQQIDELIAAHVRLKPAQRRERIIELLASVHLPDPARLIDSYPHELSGGQRQRAMIAMALILEPRIIIADEPTTALDVTTQAQILKLLKELQAAHRTGVLYITHDFGVVAEIADRVAVMQRGRLVEIGPASQVLQRPQHPYTRSLIAAVPRLEPGPRRGNDAAPSVLRISDLNKTYVGRRSLFGGRGRRVHAVNGVSLELKRGDTLGIVGESGSGKSTVARLITRIIEADSGQILLDDTNLLALSRRQMRPYRKRVQMVFQDPFGSLNPRYKVGRLIAEGAMVHGAAKDDAYRRARELLQLVGLDERAADRYPHEFSGGQRQRIGIARALVLDPSVLVADEPVSALDVSVQAQVLRLLTDIRDQLSLSMVFITHDLRVAAQLCDTVAVMSQGCIVEFGRVAQIFGDPQHEYTRSLLQSVPGKHWTPPVDGAP
jgi:peptide/nickel transport system ATP-binding protein